MKPFSLFIAILLFLAFSLLYTSCYKEYSYEGGPMSGMAGGTAVYSLEGEGGNCNISQINGSYVEGVTLLPSNYVQLRVNVTTIGTYTLSTNLNNGVQFSASGNFSFTGLQTITLIGSGIPLVAGVFPFTPPKGLGCTFFISVSPASNALAHFALEGTPGNCSNFKVNGTYNSGIPLGDTNTVEVMVNVTSIGAYSISTDTLDGISFSQSGNFTVIGIQKVILKGSGTPVNPNAITFSPKTGTSACSFSLTVLTPELPANYILASNPDSTCNGYSVPGSFYAGTPISSSNTMAIKVFVNVLGNFSISTNTVNGMTFSRTGTFISLGSQIVILHGSGTPIEVGVFTFTPHNVVPNPSAGGACNLEVYVF